MNVSSLNESTAIPPELPDFCDSSTLLDLRDHDKESLSGYFYSRGESNIILTFYPFTVLFGVIANSLFLLVLFRIPEMRTVTNAYLGNLAVADLLIITSVNYQFLGFYLISPQVKTLGYRSSFGMGLNVTIQYTATFTSTTLVFVMTVERYLGICKPLYHRMVMGKCHTFILIAGTWIFGAVFSCILIAPRSYVLVKTCVMWPENEDFKNLPNVIHSRAPIREFYQNMPPIFQLLLFALVMICNTVMYAQIIKKLHERVSQFTQETRQVMQTRNQVARLLIANGTVFFLCYIPFYIFRFNASLLAFSHQKIGFKLTSNQRGVIDWMVVALLMINSIINPVIYSVTNPRYRAAFAQVFCCRGFRRSKGTTFSQDSS